MIDAPTLELADDWESINDWFLAHDLTDGLPIVPPTENARGCDDGVRRA